jgi:hypothetical protein
MADSASTDAGSNRRSQAPLNAQLAASSVADSSAQGNVLAPNTSATPLQNNQNGAAPIFTVPKGEALFAPIEIDDNIDGIINEPSYLFITGDWKQWRAYIVPKNNPGKQYEIPTTNWRLDTDSHKFRIELGQGHNLFLGDGSSLLDGHDVRTIESFPERHKLVKEKHLVGVMADSELKSLAWSVTGDSWTFLEKDNKTGRIIRFTQSGTSELGRLEFIQGDPLTDDAYEDHGGTKLIKDERYWLSDGEIDRPPISVSEGVRLPEHLRYQAIMLDRGYEKDGDLVAEHRSLSQLISREDREKEVADRAGLAARLNAAEGPSQTSGGMRWPKP